MGYNITDAASVQQKWSKNINSSLTKHAWIFAQNDLTKVKEIEGGQKDVRSSAQTIWLYKSGNNFHNATTD